MYEGCFKIDVSIVLFRANRAMYDQNHLMSTEWPLTRNLPHNFTDICTEYISLHCIHYTIHKTIGKRTENVLEMMAYIKGTSQLNIKPVHRYSPWCMQYLLGVANGLQDNLQFGS